MEFIAVVAITAFIGYYFYLQRPKVKINRDTVAVSTPICEDGAPIPVVFGTCPVRESNITWWGELRVVKPEGWPNQYWLSMQAAICHGKIDSLVAIYSGDKRLTDGPLNYDGMFRIQKEMCFGGPKQGGGILGDACLSLGGASDWVGPHPGVYSNTAKANGEANGKGPGNFGIATVEFINTEMGNNPTLSPFSFVVQRIMRTNAGKDVQWLPQYAAIGHGCTAEKAWGYHPNTSTEEPHGDLDDWLAAEIPNDDDFVSEWLDEPLMMPFMSEDATPPSGLPSSASNVVWSSYAHVWTKQTIHVDRTNLDGRLYVYLNCNRKAWVWVDGVCIGHNDPLVDNGSVNLEFSTKSNIGGTLGDAVDHALGAAGSHTIVIYAVDPDDHGSGHYLYARIVETPVNAEQIDAATLYGLKDMNAAHVVYECMTDSVWGLGYSTLDMGTSFADTAKKLYQEGYGVSLLWSKQVTIEDFIRRVLELINGTLYKDNYTGKWELKLVRDDYDVQNLITLDDEWISSVESVKRRQLGDLTSQVVVSYTSSIAGDTATVAVMDSGLVQAQGGVVSESKDYAGITTHALAAIVAARDLRILSTPSTTCTFVAGRKAARLQPGDPFILNKPSHGLNNEVMRVAEMELGNGRTNAVRVTCVSDVFTAPRFTTVGPEDTQQVDPKDGAVDVAVDPISVPVESYASTFCPVHITDKALTAPVSAVFNNSGGCGADIFPDAIWENLGPSAPDVYRSILPGEGPLDALYFQYGVARPYVGMRFAAFSANGLPAGRWKHSGIFVIEQLGYQFIGAQYVPVCCQVRRAPDMPFGATLPNGLVFNIASDPDTDPVYGGKYLRLTSTPPVDVGTTELTWSLDNSYAEVRGDKLLKLSETSQGDGSGESFNLSATSEDPGTWINFNGDAFPATLYIAGSTRFSALVQRLQGYDTDRTRLECQLCLKDDPDNPTVLATAETDLIFGPDPHVVKGVVFNNVASAMDSGGLRLRFRLLTDSTEQVVVTFFWSDGQYQTRVETPLILSEVKGFPSTPYGTTIELDANGILTIPDRSRCSGEVRVSGSVFKGIAIKDVNGVGFVAGDKLNIRLTTNCYIHHGESVAAGAAGLDIAAFSNLSGTDGDMDVGARSSIELQYDDTIGAWEMRSQPMLKDKS